LRGLHEVLVEELRGTGVKVTWIEPSAIDTPLWDSYDTDRRPDLPARSEMLRPEAIADAVFFAIVQPRAVSVEKIVIRSNPVANRE
jgi:NADP-dependent 3-hydroxy acid dehydrogenase YdfG